LDDLGDIEKLDTCIPIWIKELIFSVTIFEPKDGHERDAVNKLGFILLPNPNNIVKINEPFKE
jgi:hypothetical protein